MAQKAIATMNRQEILDKISKALAVLAEQTRIENYAGFFSKNRLIEDLFIPAFKLVLNARNLRNLNQTKVNSPYIDLADEHLHLAIQVTTDQRAEKITDTLYSFISEDYHKRFKRLVFFISTTSNSQFSRRSRLKWKTICGRKLRFDPSADIINIPTLNRLITGLADSDLRELYAMIAQSVIGEDYIDVESRLADQCKRQLDYEKASGKYIPDIFVETRETKNLARIFCHPQLFFHRTVESLGRMNIPGWNRFLAKAGLPPLPLPEAPVLPSTPDLEGISTVAATLSLELGKLTPTLIQYENLSSKNPPPFQVDKGREYFYEQNTFTLQSGLGWGLNRQIKEIQSELSAATANVFILTGRAGQGKTNFVCDFVEKFLLKHRILCAYFSGRRIGSMASTDLSDIINKLMLDGKTRSFAEAAELLSRHANYSAKPVVLIIDGLNEHRQIVLFADQLEHFIMEMLRYPNLKLLVTCRSEFFQQRFGDLVKPPLGACTFLVEANENRLDEESYDEMLAGYFKFFQVDGTLVPSEVRDTLKKDILLLRFFCEAYGARGKPQGYKQKAVSNIYRERIFETYLQQKLGTANAFLKRFTGKASPINERTDLLAVLERCLDYMLENWQFADVPVSEVPTQLHDALYALLDEELILRRDPPSDSTVFRKSTEAVNFTFDEFRDFLLAQYILQRIYDSDRARFEGIIARENPKATQNIEGLKKFLFYASRKKENSEFWEFYRDKAWYKDAYDLEIFNIDIELLKTEDVTIVKKAILKNDERALAFAIRLALNWNPFYYRLLNLDLLMSIVAESDDSTFDHLIRGGFRTIPNYNEGRSAKGFCKFIMEKILPDFRPGDHQSDDSLFRFLILLLPVDSDANLDSESFVAFRKLSDEYPDYACSLLQQSLRYKPTRHRPYVWRLLSLASVPMSLVESFKAEAEKDFHNSGPDHVLHREVSRFLKKLGSAETASVK